MVKTNFFVKNYDVLFLFAYTLGVFVLIFFRTSLVSTYGAKTFLLTFYIYSAIAIILAILTYIKKKK